MRAIVCEAYTGYQDLKLRDVAPPPLLPGCVRIAVKYCCVGFGTSLIVAGRYQRKPPLPFVPGTEVSGVVTEVAREVSHLAVGDRVAGLDAGADDYLVKPFALDELMARVRAAYA